MDYPNETRRGFSRKASTLVGNIITASGTVSAVTVQ